MLGRRSLYGDGSQHTDTHSVIDHRQPHCTSHQLYKGILDGKSRAVFNGKVFVRHGAQKTDAHADEQESIAVERSARWIPSRNWKSLPTM